MKSLKKIFIFPLLFTPFLKNPFRQKFLSEELQSNEDISKYLIEKDSDNIDLYVEKSTLPNPSIGLGLFAKREFEEGELLGEYRGPIIKVEDSELEEFTDETKMLQVNDKFIIIGKSIVSYANDCIEIQLKKFMTEEYNEWIEKKTFPNYEGCEYNAHLRFLGNKAFLFATKEILIGQEIFLDYGFDYWKNFYENSFKT